MRFAADENFDGRILEGLRARHPDFDVVRIQDTEMAQAPDPELLGWAAREGRILLTHDLSTIPGHFYNRIRAGLPVPGVIEVPRKMPIGQVVHDLELIITAGTSDDFQGKIFYLPIR